MSLESFSDDIVQKLKDGKTYAEISDHLKAMGLQRGSSEANIRKLLLAYCYGRYLVNNEALVQRLAETSFMRRAAQLTAYIYHRGRMIGDEVAEKVKEAEMTEHLKKGAGDARERAGSFQQRFSKELKDGFQKLNEGIEEQKRKER